MLGGDTSEGGHSLAAFEEDGDASSTAGALGTSSQDGIPDELHNRLGAHGVGSIASTYWRPERRDRGGLSILDERHVPTILASCRHMVASAVKPKNIAVRANLG